MGVGARVEVRRAGKEWGESPSRNQLVLNRNSKTVCLAFTAKVKQCSNIEVTQGLITWSVSHLVVSSYFVVRIFGCDTYYEASIGMFYSN